MRIFIIEDDISIVNILEDIIDREHLGTVCGSMNQGDCDLGEILALNPDLILVDLLMPGKDGIQVVRELKNTGIKAKFIMISQVTAKEMVARAYQAGIEFFIHKPINLIEIRKVVSTVLQQIENERSLSAIQSLLQPREQQSAPPTGSQETLWRQRLVSILGQLGLAGERGAEDIVKMCLFLLERQHTISQIGVGNLCAQLSDKPKSMEQRVRRSIERGLTHLASLGVEDYSNEYFNRYASILYPFSEVREEMAYIQGKGQGGKVNLKKFLDGMLLLLEEF